MVVIIATRREIKKTQPLPLIKDENDQPYSWYIESRVRQEKLRYKQIIKRDFRVRRRPK